MLRPLAAYARAFALLLAVAGPAAAQSDIILRSSNATTIRGNWTVTPDTTAAGGNTLASDDNGWSSTNAPSASPADYFEVTFSAPANTPYHVWFRMRASGNSKYNDSVWVQYSDATNSSGTRVYPIGSTSGLDVNLERCASCGPSGWGWQDGAYWLSQTTTVRFSTTGTHTLRVQTREDGVQIDQIVLSPATYLYEAPGSATNDSTIVTATTAIASTATAGPYSGSPVSLPGRVQAENFDHGGENVSWHDATAGNSGNVYRQTSVDLQASSAGGYNIGWTSPGEWVNYTVNVATAGSYTAHLRVASMSGTSLHLGFNTASNVWKTVSIPATGGWQTWTTVSVPVTLGAGRQQITVMFDNGGVNLDYIEVTSGSSSTTPPPTTTGGSTLPVVTWNVKVDGSATHAQGVIDRLMALSPRPQVVVLEEAMRSQLNTYLSRLQTKTGQTWRGIMATHCPPGAWNGSSCSSSEDEGVVVLTPLQIMSSSTGFLGWADQWHSARGFVRVAVNVGGLTVQVFGVHLQPNNATARNNSMSYLKSYSSNYSGPKIMAGDFNAGRDQVNVSTGMAPAFLDCWNLVGSGTGNTAFTPSPSMVIDFWLTDASKRAMPTATRVVTETGTFSDHLPVFTTFSVK